MKNNKIYKLKCFQCGKLKKYKEISYPAKNSPYANKPICQSCLAGVLSGNISLKDN